MKKLYLMLVVFIIGAWLLAACGAAPQPSGGGAPAPSGSSGETKATQAPAQPTQPPPTQPPPAQPTKPPANPSSGTTGQLNLSDVTDGLSALDSYKSAFAMSFDGTQDSQPKKWSLTIAEEYVKDPPAKHTIMTGEGTDVADKTGGFESIEAGGKAYAIIGTTCVSYDAKDAPKPTTTLTPASLIGDIRSSQLLGTETVNGVATLHYAVDLSNYATSASLTNATSEVWVAQPGNYVVKYIFEGTGQDVVFGQTAKTTGTMRWTYDLTNINQPLTIKPPDNCGGAEDIPLMADAQDKSSFGGMTTYSSPSKLEDVVAFYQKEMIANGWQAQEGGTSVPGTMATLDFTKDKRTVQILITFDQDKQTTTVLITVQQPNQ